MDGFRLHTADSSAGPGPFRLEGSADGGATWRLVGAPSPRLTRRGIRFLADDDADPAHTAFDHRPPWTVGVACGSHLAAGLALCAAAAAAAVVQHLDLGGGDLMRRLRPARSAAVSAAALAALEAARLGGAARGRDAFLPAALCVIWCAAAAALFLAGRRLPLRVAAVAVAAVAARVVDDCAVFRDCSNLADSPPYPAAVALVAALVAALAASRAARSARRAVAGDQRCYATAWAAVCDREPAALRSLAATVDGLEAAARDGHAGAGDGACVGPSPSGPLRQDGPAPASLDRLWAQAVGLAPLLAPSVAAWAAAGGGTVRCPPLAGRTDGYSDGRRAPGTEDGGPGGVEGIGGWAGAGSEEWLGLVKDPRRAAWKALSCYSGDAGRLLDLCRARLVFPDAGGAAACLRAVAADPGARVLRVRNGMRDDWDGGGGGFRCVTVNLCLVTRAAEALCVERHVCELQLVHADLLDPPEAHPWPERHARYLDVRLLRAGDSACSLSSAELCRVANATRSATERKGFSALNLINSKAGGDCSANGDCSGIVCYNVEQSMSPNSPSGLDHADAITPTILSAGDDGCALSGLDGAQAGHHSGGSRSSGYIFDAASDFCGIAGGACAGSGNCSKNSDCMIARRESIEIIIKDSSHDEDEIEQKGSVGGTFVESQALAETAEFPILVTASAQAERRRQQGWGILPVHTAISSAVELVTRSASAQGRYFRRRALVEDTDEACSVSDAAPPAAVAALRRDNSTLGIMNPDGLGDFEGIAGGLIHGVCEGSGGGGAAAATEAEMAALLAVYLRRVQPCRESLDRRAQSAGEALLRSDLGSALFTSRPLAAAMSKRAFQALSFAVACYFGGLRLPAGTRTFSNGCPFSLEPDRACFVPLSLRKPALPPARARVAAFGLTSGGCPLPGAIAMPPPPVIAGAGAVCVRLPAPASADGYFLETGVDGDGDDADPVQWVVKAFNGGAGDTGNNSTLIAGGEDWTKWQSVGASAWELWYTGELRLYPDLPYPTPSGGSARLEVAVAPGWEWCIGWPVSQGVQLLCFATMAVAGAAGREGWAQGILAGGYGLLVALNVTAALGLGASERWREAVQYWLSLVPGAMLSAGAALLGRYILSVFAAVAVTYCIVQAREEKGSCVGAAHQRSKC